MVGRHRYNFSGRVSLDGERFTGSLGYSYYGAGNPVLGISVGQAHDASSRTVPVLVAEDETRGVLPAREGALGEAVGVVPETPLPHGHGVLAERQPGARERHAAGPGGRRRSHAEQGIPIRRRGPTFAQMRTTISFSNVQRRSFSISREDGVSVWVSWRMRRVMGLQRSLRGLIGRDRGFAEATGEMAAYKGLGGWGFANHVVALRASGGIGMGSGAHAFHFDVGGAEGMPEAISGFGLFGGSGKLLPVRGYQGNARFGRIAWSASAEYRFPLALVDRGVGRLPLFFDRLHGSLFFDAGNAWGPVLGEQHVNYHNPRRPMIMSVGAEASIVVVPIYQGGLTVRFGTGLPLVDGDGPTFHIRVGNAF